jgi:lipid II:glycine glycyltransferase (peptidoglycan interpeptide bridge formation enzyme)
MPKETTKKKWESVFDYLKALYDNYGDKVDVSLSENNNKLSGVLNGIHALENTVTQKNTEVLSNLKTETEKLSNSVQDIMNIVDHISENQ